MKASRDERPTEGAAPAATEGEAGREAPERAPAEGVPRTQAKRPVTELPAERPAEHRERARARPQPTEGTAPTPTQEQRPPATRPVRELAETDERGTGATRVRPATRRKDRKGVDKRVHGLNYRITAIPPGTALSSTSLA